MPLQTGLWKINVNATISWLEIDSVDVSGNVTGNLFGFLIFGFWDEISQRLTFTHDRSSTAYPGFLFSDQNRMPGIIGGSVFTLAGVCTSLTQNAASADRHTFGWYAQIGSP